MPFSSCPLMLLAGPLSRHRSPCLVKILLPGPAVLNSPDSDILVIGRSPFLSEMIVPLYISEVKFFPFRIYCIY